MIITVDVNVAKTMSIIVPDDALDGLDEDEIQDALLDLYENASTDQIVDVNEDYWTVPDCIAYDDGKGNEVTVYYK